MGQKLIYPSASRNAEAIYACLEGILPESGRVLEIASGSGQHIAGLAAQYPSIQWQPSDPDETARASIEAWRAEPGHANLLPVRDIDVMQEGWWQAVSGPLEGILAINMIHISPWPSTLGLMRGSSRLLRPDGFLYLYGAYKIDGAHTTKSNEAFDASLRARNPQWGVRDKGDVIDAAAQNDLCYADFVAMPANNFSLIFRKASDRN